MISKIVLSDESEFAIGRPLPFGENARNKPRIVEITEGPQGDILHVRCSDGSAVWVYPSTIRYVVIDNGKSPAPPAPTPKPRVTKPKVSKPVSAKVLTPPRPGCQVRSQD